LFELVLFKEKKAFGCMRRAARSNPRMDESFSGRKTRTFHDIRIVASGIQQGNFLTWRFENKIDILKFRARECARRAS